MLTFNLKRYPVLFTLALVGKAAFAIECDMKHEFYQRDNGGESNISVWSDTTRSSLLFISSLHTNTDGTGRSYSVEDFWGEKNALNNLCNAMSDACVGLSSEGKRNRRILTQKAYKNGDWDSNLLKQSKISPDIIPMVKGKPCPLVDGFLVSATALHKNNVQDVCDINNYVDSLTTSAIVIPKGKNGFSKNDAKVGDLVVVMKPESNEPFFAVIGDTGPSSELGEASIALNGKLKKKESPPDNYNHVRGKKPYEGQGWDVSNAAILIFPNTRNNSEPMTTQNVIDATAKGKFEKWGGIERFNSCVRKYSK